MAKNNVVPKICGENFTLYNGDSCRVMTQFPDRCFDLSLHSPPFSAIYIYSDNVEDLGNCQNNEQFFEQYKFIVKELYRTTRNGRIAAVHCKDLPEYKSSTGHTGIYEFSDDIIKLYKECGWVYHSRITLQTDPVLERAKTNCQRLLQCQMRKDSSHSGVGLPEYILLFRKWGEGEETPITHDEKDISLDLWQRYANPVWCLENNNAVVFTDVLNARIARTDEDEKHLCPLSLDVIRRIVHLYSNKGEILFTPFLGVGSEVYGALELGRKGVGIELKNEYFGWAGKYCSEIEQKNAEPTIFDFMGDI